MKVGYTILWIHLIHEDWDKDGKTWNCKDPRSEKNLSQASTTKKAPRAKLININLPRAVKVHFVSLQFERNSATTNNYPKSGFCNIFCNWGISRGPQENLPRAVCCADLP